MISKRVRLVTLRTPESAILARICISFSRLFLYHEVLLKNCIAIIINMDNHFVFLREERLLCALSRIDVLRSLLCPVNQTNTVVHTYMIRKVAGAYARMPLG